MKRSQLKQIIKEIIDKNSSLEEEKLSNLTKIEPYNNPKDEYSQDLDGYLKDDNIDWREESYITLLNPNKIKPSEWNYLSDDPKNPKSIKYSKLNPSKFPPILALKTGPNSYEAIDGIHRVYAFRLTNHMIPAIVITPKLEQGLSTNDIQMVNFMYNKYKDHNIPTPVIIKENMKKSQLRKLIKEEIQLLLERYINLFGKDEIKPYINDIWNIMQKSYEPIGGFLTANSPEELLEKVWMAKLVRKEGKIVAAMLYKDKYGRKSIAAGSDGSEIGRQAVKQMMKEDST